MIRAILVIVVVCCCTAVALQCRAQSASETPSRPILVELLDWAEGQAIPLDTVTPGGDAEDLKALDEVIGDARIVLMGDSRHDAREQWMLKHRIIEYLVKNLGFSVLAMEESLPCTSALNECLLGEQDDLETALSDLGGWYLWDAEEMLALMSTLRTHNADTATERPVRVYGFDISDGARRGVENTLALLAEIDAEVAEQLRNSIDLSPFGRDFWMQTIQNYGALTPEATESIGAGLADLVNTVIERKDELIAKTSERDYKWALRQAIVARQVHDMMLAFKAGSFEAGGSAREAAMVENLKWLLGVAAPDERFIVWAHNFHIARTPQYLEIPGRPPTTMTPLGYLLSEEFGDSTVTIGFSFEKAVEPSTLRPAPEDWVDGVMARVGPDVFLLDLRAAPKEGLAHEWLYADQSMRGEGGKAVLVPAKAFDVIAFVREVGTITRTKNAIARFEALNSR